MDVLLSAKPALGHDHHMISMVVQSVACPLLRQTTIVDVLPSALTALGQDYHFLSMDVQSAACSALDHHRGRLAKRLASPWT